MWLFFTPMPWRGIFFYNGEIMTLSLIHNTDTSAGLAYKIARIVYAHTGAQSLSGVEAFTSMIKNLSDKSGVKIEELIQDKNIFDALSDVSLRHTRMHVCPNERGFKMCLRTAQRMLRGGLGDCCFGATRFHHSSEMPDWARARGYIADIDEILFYL